MTLKLIEDIKQSIIYKLIFVKKTKFLMPKSV